MRTGIFRRGRAAVDVARAEHPAGLGIGLRGIGEEHRDALVEHILAAGAEGIGEPAGGLELEERVEALGLGGARTLLPFVGSIVPGGGVEQPEARGALRIGGGEGERDAAAHRRPRDHGGAPADVVQEIGKVVGEGLDPIGTVRLVGAAMAAAVIDQHRRRFRQRGGDRVPEGVIHAQRMDEGDRRGVLHAAADLEGELAPVAGFHLGNCHLAQP